MNCVDCQHHGGQKAVMMRNPNIFCPLQNNAFERLKSSIFATFME